MHEHLRAGAFFASVAQRLQPRFYSISSSPLVDPNLISLTCAVVSGITPTGPVLSWNRCIKQMRVLIIVTSGWSTCPRYSDALKASHVSCGPMRCMVPCPHWSPNTLLIRSGNGGGVTLQEVGMHDV